MTKAEDNFDKKKQEFNKQLDSYQLNPDEKTMLLYDAIIDLLNSATNTSLLEEAKKHIKDNFSVKSLNWDTFKNNVMLAKLREITKSMHNSSFKIDRSNLFKHYNFSGGFKKKSRKRKKRIKKSRKKSRKKKTYK